MKYQLETIPVHDAWAADDPCPMCSLMEQAELRHMEYYLGNSVMNPETRLEVNRTGFCTRHFPMMRDAGHAHHLGLIAHTHLQSVRSRLKGNFRELTRSASPKAAAAFSKAVRQMTKECLVCRSMERDLKRYAYTAIVMFDENEEFQDIFLRSTGPCLTHAADMAEMAAEILKKNHLKFFLKEMTAHIDSGLEALESDVLRFTQKFDSQNDDMEWGESRHAHARAVQVLSGRAVRTED